MLEELGYFEVYGRGRDYELRPTLGNLMQLGSPSELLEIYNILNLPIEGWETSDCGRFLAKSFDVVMSLKASCQINTARRLIMACCDDKTIADLMTQSVIGSNGRIKTHKKMGDVMSIPDQILVAAGLARHGLAGVRKKPRPGARESKSIDLAEFIHAAMMHLDLSKEEAENITLTEFCRLMDIKYPDNNRDAPDLEAHRRAMAALESGEVDRVNAERMRKAGIH